MRAMGIIFANNYDSSMGGLTNKRTMAAFLSAAVTVRSTSPFPT